MGVTYKTMLNRLSVAGAAGGWQPDDSMRQQSDAKCANHTQCVFAVSYRNIIFTVR